MHQMKEDGGFVLVVKFEPGMVILSFCKLNSCQHQLTSRHNRCQWRHNASDILEALLVFHRTKETGEITSQLCTHKCSGSRHTKP